MLDIETSTFSGISNFAPGYIDKENEPDLFIVVPDAPDYYMGDKKKSKDTSDPYIRYIDEETGTYYEEKEKVEVVDIKIIEWKNNCTFLIQLFSINSIININKSNVTLNLSYTS